MRRVLTSSLPSAVAMSIVTVARAEYTYHTCGSFGRYRGLPMWLAVGCAWCLLYPFVATIWIKHRVARQLADMGLGTAQSADGPGTGVIACTVAVAVLSFAYWFVIGFACSLGAYITPLGALLPYFAAATALIGINVWLASKRIVAWHARRTRA